MLPDRITPADNLNILPPPNADWLLEQMDVDATPTNSQARGRGRPSNREINLQEDFNNSQFLQNDNMDDDELALAPNEDLELELDFGMDIDEHPRMEKSIEMGRDAPIARAVEDDIFSELDGVAPAKGADRAQSSNLDFGDDGIRIADGDGDIQMDDDFQFNIGDQSAVPEIGGAAPPNRHCLTSTRTWLEMLRSGQKLTTRAFTNPARSPRNLSHTTSESLNRSARFSGSTPQPNSPVRTSRSNNRTAPIFSRRQTLFQGILIS
jgi:hypothetical protein